MFHSNINLLGPEYSVRRESILLKTMLEAAHTPRNICSELLSESSQATCLTLEKLASIFHNSNVK
jgi:hypothetical protein